MNIYKKLKQSSNIFHRKYTYFCPAFIYFFYFSSKVKIFQKILELLEN